MLLATCHLLLATDYLPLATCYLLLATCYWLLATGYWLLATGCLPLAACYSLLAACYLLLATCYLPSPPLLLMLWSSDRIALTPTPVLLASPRSLAGRIECSPVRAIIWSKLLFHRRRSHPFDDLSLCPESSRAERMDRQVGDGVGLAIPPSSPLSHHQSLSSSPLSHHQFPVTACRHLKLAADPGCITFYSWHPTSLGFLLTGPFPTSLVEPCRSRAPGPRFQGVSLDSGSVRPSQRSGFAGHESSAPGCEGAAFASHPESAMG